MRPGKPVNTTATGGLLWNTQRHMTRYKKKWGDEEDYPICQLRTSERWAGLGPRVGVCVNFTYYQLTSINHSTCKVGVYRWEPSHSPVNRSDWPGINPDHNVTSLRQRHDRTIILHVGWLWKRFIKRKLSAILIRTMEYTSHGESRRYWPPRAVGKYCRISRRWRPGGCYLLVCGLWNVKHLYHLPLTPPSSFLQIWVSWSLEDYRNGKIGWG